MNIFQPMITNTAVSKDESIFDGVSNDMSRCFTFDFLTTSDSSPCQQKQSHAHVE